MLKNFNESNQFNKRLKLEVREDWVIPENLTGNFRVNLKKKFEEVLFKKIGNLASRIKGSD